VTFFNELLHVKRSRATSSSLEKTTTSEERDDRKHLRGRSKLEDREKISVIISQNVSCDRDSLLTDSHSLTTEATSINGVHYL
jgi:hypothetical protein